MTTDFQISSQIVADTQPIGDLPLSTVLLMEDMRFPWLILVPRRANVTEFTDLSQEDSFTLMNEIRFVTKALHDAVGSDKMNVGSLGNIVRQLHIHIVARRVGDDAWPKPVWGTGARKLYDPRVRDARVLALRHRLGLDKP